jgi:glycosyltransferase involved in cell wall biosynthesis
LIEDKIQSSYGARNKGIKNAQGEVIAFTDSDCIPADEWIKNGVANLLKTENCGLVAGEIDIFFRKPNTPNAVELYDSIFGFNQKQCIEKYRYGCTANVFTSKKVIENVGIFNDVLKSSGDYEWGRRVYSFGYKQVYADNTRIAHPARCSFGELYQRIVRITGGGNDLYWRNSFKEIIKVTIKGVKNIFSISARIALGMYPAEGLPGVKKKIQIIFVLLVVEIIRTWEKIRLVMGGKSKR